MRATVSSGSSTERLISGLAELDAGPGASPGPASFHSVNTLLHRMARGCTIEPMTTNAALRETTRRVVSRAMRSMMFMMMMPMMHRQPSL